MAAKMNGSGVDGSEEQTGPKVLFLGHTGQMGGAEFSLEALLSRLPVGKRVVLLSPGPLLDRLRKTDISVDLLPSCEGLVSLGKETGLLQRLWSLRQLPGTVLRLAKLASASDLVYANSKKVLLYALLAARLARKPLIWHQRDKVILPSELALRARLSEKLLMALLNRYASRIVSVSGAAAASFVSAGGRPQLPVVIHNGLDSTLYTRNTDARALRRGVGLPVDQPLIGCFGRLTSWKGQAVLVEALSEVPEAHLVLVGGDVFDSGDFKDSLVSLVDRLGLRERVHFLGHRDDVPALMQAVDVVAHPSTEFDPCPRVVLEALHSGVPLVATDVGGTPELIESRVSGLLVPPSDPGALAEALRFLLTNPAEGQRLAAQGQRRALEMFTLDRVVTQVEEEIRTLTTSHL